VKSVTVPSFWEAYRGLEPDVKVRARKAFILWSEDPFHPSLRFKCVNPDRSVWSVRISLAYRALGVLDGSTVTWIWIGGHDEYERMFG
jgi:hypothetical protein